MFIVRLDEKGVYALGILNSFLLAVSVTPSHSSTKGLKPTPLQTACWALSGTVELLCELKAVKGKLPCKSLSKPLIV